jgi:hypothetical protein
MRKALVAGITLYLALTASQVLSQDNMTSNGRYMPPAFCFGVVVTSNMAIPMIAKDTSLAQQITNPPFSETQIELLKQQAIDMSKWEGSYTDWNSDFGNGGEYIMRLTKNSVGTPAAQVLVSVLDKMKLCYQTFAPK